MSEMGYKEEEKIQVKKEFLQMITRMELNSAKQRIVYGFFEVYLKLTKQEEEQLMKEIEDLPEAEKILEIPISYEEKGKELGKEIGKEIGKKEVAMEMLKKGLDVNLIAEVTHLKREEIEGLKER